MTLQTWFEAASINPDKGLCLSIGTDGLDPKKNQLMSVSYKSEKIPLQTIYVKQPLSEADAEKVQEYTGVSAERYSSKAIYFNEALLKLKPILDNVDFIVSYSCSSFLKPWIKNVLTCMVDFPLLDLSAVFKLKDRNGIIRYDLTTIEALDKSIADQTTFIRAGYSIESLVHRYIGCPVLKGKPALETRPQQLYLLFGIALQLIF